MQSKNPLLGIVFMLSAAFIFACSDALTKYMTVSVPVTQMVFFRVLFGIALLLGYCLIKNNFRLLMPNHWRLFALRSLFGAGVALSFIALKYIPLLEFVTICYAAPLVVALMSPWYLKEKVGKKQWLYIGLGFLGLLVALRPNFNDWGFGHVVAVMDMLCYTALMLISRKHSGKENTLVANLSIYPLILVISGLIISQDWQPVTQIGLFQCFLLAIFNTAGMILVFKSLQYANAAVIAPLDYSNFVWAAIFGALLFQEFPDTLMLIGVCIVVLSGTLLVRQHRA